MSDTTFSQETTVEVVQGLDILNPHLEIFVQIIGAFKWNGGRPYITYTLREGGCVALGCTLMYCGGWVGSALMYVLIMYVQRILKIYASFSGASLVYS